MLEQAASSVFFLLEKKNNIETILQFLRKRFNFVQLKQQLNIQMLFLIKNEQVREKKDPNFNFKMNSKCIES